MATEAVNKKMRAAMDALIENREIIRGLEAFFRSEFPEQWEEYETARRRTDSLVTVAKAAMAAMDEGKHTYKGFSTKVTRPNQTIVETDKILEDAKEFGHLDELMKSGFVTHTVDATKIQFVAPKILPLYERYVRKEKKKKPTVTLPKELK